MTVIRTALIKLIPNDKQKDYLDDIIGKVITRAADVLEVFLSLRSDNVDVRRGDNIETKTYNFSNYCGKPDNDAVTMGKELYKLLIGTSMARSVRGPFVLPGYSGQKDKSKIAIHLRSMFYEKGLLPIPSLVPGTNYDFAAFQLAHAALRSWDDRNDETIKNYAEQVEKVNKMEVDAPSIEQLQNWLNKHKLYLTRKIVKKFSKFGWTTRLRNYHLEELQAINSDESHWLNLFVWRVEQDRLDRLRPSAAFTFPDLENSRRSVPFGENYQKFNLFTKNNSIILKLGQHEIPGMPSSYFKDLKIDKIGSSYIFKYIRGNNSPLDESVTAELNEVSIFTKNGNYYLSLPLNVQVPEPCQEAIELLNYCKLDNGSWFSDIRIMGVDLGINAPATCFVANTEAEGQYENIASFVIGEHKDENYCRLMENLRARIKNAFEAIDDLREKTKELESFSPLWFNYVMDVANRVKSIKKEMNQLRRFDIHKARNQGVSYEQVKFIQLYKLYIGLLQKWTYFGTKPSDKGKTRKGFKIHYRRLDMLKLDFRKKVACEIVRKARMHGVSIIVAEDLQKFLPDQENKTSTNELLMLWGSGQIGKWLQHFAVQYGIIVHFINPEYTSQIDPLTGFFGSRSKFDKQEIKVERDGEILVMNADRNAAENIANTFMKSEANKPVIKAYIVPQGFALACKTEKDKNNRWRELQIRKVFNGCRLIVNGQPQCISDEELNKLKLGKEEKLFKYPDGWQVYAVHEQRKKRKLRDWWGIEIKNKTNSLPKSLKDNGVKVKIKKVTTRKKTTHSAT